MSLDTIVWIVYPLAYWLIPIFIWVLYVKSRNVAQLVLADGSFFGGAFQFFAFFVRKNYLTESTAFPFLGVYIFVGIVINILLVRKVRQLKLLDEQQKTNRHKTDKLEELDFQPELDNGSFTGYTTNLHDPSVELSQMIGMWPAGAMIRPMIQDYTWGDLARLNDDYFADRAPAISAIHSKCIINHAREALYEDPSISNQHPNI